METIAQFLVLQVFALGALFAGCRLMSDARRDD